MISSMLIALENTIYISSFPQGAAVTFTEGEERSTVLRVYFSFFNKFPARSVTYTEESAASK